MTDTATNPSNRLVTGREQFDHAFKAATSPESLVNKTGIYGLTWFIQAVLDEHYPADVFGDGSKLYESWASEHGGDDIDPGVKWANLLRAAIKQVVR